MKNKEDMKFGIFVIFNKTFLEQSYQYANEGVNDLIALQFSRYFVYKILKIFIFLLKHVKSCLHIKYIGANILHLFRVDIRQVLLSHG